MVDILTGIFWFFANLIAACVLWFITGLAEMGAFAAIAAVIVAVICIVRNLDPIAPAHSRPGWPMVIVLSVGASVILAILAIIGSWFRDLHPWDSGYRN